MTAPEPARKDFRHALSDINDRILLLFAMVRDGVAHVSEVFVSGDRHAAQKIIGRRRVIDSLYEGVEQLVLQQIALQAPVAADMRFLVTALRVVPELDRCGDLVEHIAQRCALGIADELTPRARGIVAEMGRLTHEMWNMAHDGWRDRDVSVPGALRARDAEVDDLHVSLTAEIVGAAMPTPVVMEMTLVGRFYERLGDHAADVGGRISYVVDA